jgi:hypothetical protein
MPSFIIFMREDDRFTVPYWDAAVHIAKGCLALAHSESDELRKLAEPVKEEH